MEPSDRNERGEPTILGVADLDRLIEVLRSKEYRVIGPTVRDGAIVYDMLGSAAELPVGVADEQQAGRYRLSRRGDGARFGFSVGPQSWKKVLYPPLLTLWTARRAERGFDVSHEATDAERYAFLGVRACELAALATLDRVLMGGSHVDPSYKARREPAFVVAVNCTQAGGTCFCASLQTGPRASSGFDLALTELLEGEHRFLVEIGSPRGAGVAAELPLRPAGEVDLAAAARGIEGARTHMGRTLDTQGIKQLLYRHYESPHWDQVASRCLACANCTMVCPTCFCANVVDLSDLTGAEATRRRSWDSCFTLDFSYIHGGSVRTSTGARYRQWITHKLATWHDQFGSSGCVGCGRCITWCPVGIDLTEEVAALRRSEAAGGGNP